MAAYQTIVVGTDGSETSLRAVDRAGALAGDTQATLLIVCAYEASSTRDVAAAQDALRGEGYQVVGSAPAEDTLQNGRDRARAAGATKIETLAEPGVATTVLRDVATRRNADLLVVGNRGLNSISGRILGSVPLDVARRAGIDVLVVHTT
ncbi:MAG: universal stress protein [Jatrophihabitans sp.]